jgi:hypothetical protein
MDLIPHQKTLIGTLHLKGRSNNLLPTGDPPHRQKQALAESERPEEDLSSQWPP